LNSPSPERWDGAAQHERALDRRRRPLALDGDGEGGVSADVDAGPQLDRLDAAAQVERADRAAAGRAGPPAAGRDSRRRRQHLWLITSFDAFDLLYTGRGLPVDEVGRLLVATAERAVCR
jgi:hypothetical protein